MLCALAQARPLPHTAFPMTPGSATVLRASPGLRPAGPPRASGRWPARCAPPTGPAPPTSAGRAGGSDRPGVPRVVALLLAPGVHLHRAVGPLFHNEGRIPT